LDQPQSEWHVQFAILSSLLKLRSNLEPSPTLWLFYFAFCKYFLSAVGHIFGIKRQFFAEI
jgi:hypothetical protein